MSRLPTSASGTVMVSVLVVLLPRRLRLQEGNLEVVQRNFHYVIFAIIFLSILPAIIEYLRARKDVPQPSVNSADA